MSQNGIRKAAAEDKEHDVAQKSSINNMWQIDCRLLLTSVTMATCTINTIVGGQSSTACLNYYFR